MRGGVDWLGLVVLMFDKSLIVVFFTHTPLNPITNITTNLIESIQLINKSVNIAASFGKHTHTHNSLGPKEVAVVVGPKTNIHTLTLRGNKNMVNEINK